MPSDLIVFSDLHLGEGLLPSGRYSPMEAFFHDEAFARLLCHLEGRYDPAQLVLVLNGDCFDFLAVTVLPDGERRDALGVTGAEVRFGLDPTADRSVFKLDSIVSGHKVFFAALAHFVAAGFRVEILRGNHDLELYYEEVQRALLAHLLRIESGLTPEGVRERVRFHQWFYLEPGRVYIEHGNQYEASNSIRYPLHPELPLTRRRLEAQLDYPLGSLFVRYFYNQVHLLNPYAPRVASFEQYLDLLIRYSLPDLLRIARDHRTFFSAALNPQAAGGRSRDSDEEDARQEADFQALEAHTASGDLFRRLNALKVHPKAASKLAFVREMTKPILRRVLWNAAFTFLALYLWILIFNTIQSPILAEGVFARASLLLLFVVLTLGSLLWGANRILMRLRRRTDVTVGTCVERAGEIAQITRVPLVLMGHTHVVDLRKLAGGRATYANSGTWIAVDNPWDNLIPDARRLTFLLVEGNGVRICRWNDDAGRIDPVPFFDLGYRIQ